MGVTAYDAYIYSLILVIVFGILGNILAIISLAREKQLSKKNCYFLVLHLAVCDLGALTMLFLSHTIYLLDVAIHRGLNISCLFHVLHVPFYYSGVAMMLTISVVRYRATVHPLKPAISRVKLIKVCFVLHVADLIIALGLTSLRCFDIELNYHTYRTFIDVSDLLLYLVPTTFMIVCYGKIGFVLVKQNKQIKRMGSVAVRNRYNRDRRIFLVCICTVVCFAVGRLLYSVSLIWVLAGTYSLYVKHIWVLYIGYTLIAAGTASANPLIYGILDRRMFRFLKLCRKKRQTPEELAFQRM